MVGYCSVHVLQTGGADPRLFGFKGPSLYGYFFVDAHVRFRYSLSAGTFNKNTFFAISCMIISEDTLQAAIPQ